MEFQNDEYFSLHGGENLNLFVPLGREGDDIFEAVGSDDTGVPYGTWKEWVDLARLILSHRNTYVTSPEDYIG